MKKILFATEFSTHTVEVFKYAADLAFFFKAKLIIMNAIGPPKNELSNILTLEERSEKAIDKMVDLLFNNLSDEYRSKLKVEYSPQIGFAADAILEVTSKKDIDLIVMGMTGKNNAFNVLVGSTTLSVLNKSNCPVLVVPATAEFSGIENIVYTTNFEFRDLEAINYLKKLAKVFDASIHCLHIFENTENEGQIQKNFQILQETYKKDKSLLFDIKKGNFEKEVNLFAKKKKADIVVMTAHKQNFIARMVKKNTVNELVQHIHLPLLVLKDTASSLKSNLWVGAPNSKNK